MICLIQEISNTVRMANDVAKKSPTGPRWSVFITNRSFIAQVFALIFAALALFGIPLPVLAEVAAEAIYGIAFVAMQLWALVERLMGKTRTIWSRQQAYKAVNEADALSKALGRAGAR